MGDLQPDDDPATGPDMSQNRAQGQSKTFESGAAFHSQLDYSSQTHSQGSSNTSAYGQRSMDMGALRTTLPQLSQGHYSSPGHYGISEGVAFPLAFHGHQMQHLAMGSVRPQQQQYMGTQFGSLPSQVPMMSRQPMHINAQAQYSHFDPYAFGMATPQMSPHDPRMAPSNVYGMPPQAPGEYGQYTRRGSEPGPIPSYPRGPPRKPKQSGHALWVGNLPPNANITDLKEHFSQDATRDIESLFLISKSNCAFVNYRTETACMAAMNRFHDSRFHGVRLVCRLRRGSASGPTAGSSLPPDKTDTPSSQHSSVGSASQVITEDSSTPTIVGGGQQDTPAAEDDNATPSQEPRGRVPEKFFIVKSLTAQDLEASIRNGIWATQSHNEKMLNEAYEDADNVYLIFSANKSGEYFGYARMASTISGEPVNLSSTFQQAETTTTGTPHSTITPATATAPKGKIIDDSARGTIFWEAEHSDNEEDSPVKGEGEGGGNQNWGRQFTIEWMSTSRLPFYRTRGLRNPWNSNREIKIARDGTELEPSVGRRVIQMFHRPSPSPAGQQQPGIFQ